MKQFITPHQNLVGAFAELSQAEAGVAALQSAGFSDEHLKVMPQELEFSPPVSETKAAQGAGGGAIAGTVFGTMAGLLLGYANAISPGGVGSNVVQVLTGITLAGAGIGAVGGGLLGALSGVKVRKAPDLDQAEPPQNYLIVAEQATEDEIKQAKALLKSFGSQLEA